MEEFQNRIIIENNRLKPIPRPVWSLGTRLACRYKGSKSLPTPAVMQAMLTGSQGTKLGIL